MRPPELERFIRKLGRTAQVQFHPLQELGKSAEHRWRTLTGKVHDRDLDGLRLIDVPAGALFLDVGANRGDSTHAFRMICPDIRVHAFEPNPVMARRIDHLYRPPDALRVVALSDHVGSFPLYVPVYRGLVFDGLASLSEEEAGRWLNRDTLFGFDPGELEIRRVACQLATLDSFGVHPFFIKIDVQGFEHEVMRGGLRTITAAEPIIFAESQVLDVERTLTLLSASGYEVFRFDGRFRRGESSESNVYLVPRSKAGLIQTA